MNYMTLAALCNDILPLRANFEQVNWTCKPSASPTGPFSKKKKNKWALLKTVIFFLKQTPTHVQMPGTKPT